MLFPLHDSASISTFRPDFNSTVYLSVQTVIFRNQRFVEFRQFGRLASDKILKCCDTLDLFVSCYRINGGLLFQFPEPENLIGNLIVSFLVVGFFEQFLLQGQ